jgi:flagellar biosynthesis protein FliQ
MVILKSIFLLIGVIVIFSSMLVLLIISIFKAIKNGADPKDL